MSRPAKILILPDVHESFEKMIHVLNTLGKTADRVVWVGDYFDAKPVSNEENVRNMALFLKNNIDNERYDFGLGNHDAHYLFDDREFKCSGYNGITKQIVTEHLGQLRHRFKLFNWLAPDVLLTHAGLSHQWLDTVHLEDAPLADLQAWTLRLQEMWVTGEQHQDCGGVTPFDLVSAVGSCRGGYHHTGGIIWCDWRYEFQPITGLTQVMGHTYMKDAPHTTPMDATGHQSFMLDSGFTHVGIATYDADRDSYHIESQPIL